MSAINLFFFIGLFLIILFYLWVFNSNNENTQTQERFLKKTKFLSIFFFIILFATSIITLKHFQNPNNNNPYFKNTNHYAISNYAIAFNNELCLYGDSAEALWQTEDKGNFKVNIVQNLINLNFRSFNVPVFEINKNKQTTLLNPKYENTPIDIGFILFNTNNIFECVNYNSPKENIYNLQFKFTTTDTVLKKKITNHYFTVNNVRIQRGISLYNLFKNAIDSENISEFENNNSFYKKFKNKLTSENYSNKENLRNFLNFLENDELSNSYFLVKTSNNKKTTLQYYPYKLNTKNYFVKFKDKIITPTKSINRIIQLNSTIFIGLENSRNPIQIRSKKIDEIQIASGFQNILEFKYFDYKPLNNNFSDTIPTNSVELKFLRNTNHDLVNSNIRDGFVFHNNLLSNDNNNYDGFIKYYNGKPNTNLDYEILSQNTIKKDSISVDLFSILSNNKNHLFLFNLKDFAKNNLTNLHIAIYLLIILLFFTYILIFIPGKNLIFIETPIYFIIYMFMTFRFLLLWRVATFPPTNNISNNELDTLLYFDFKIPFPFLSDYISPSSMIPMSLIFVILFSIIVISFRKGCFKKINKIKENLKLFEKPLLSNNYILLHGIILIFSLLFASIGIEIFIRIFGILVPVLSYLIFEQIIYNKKAIIIYNITLPRKRISIYFYNFFTTLIRTQVFYLSLMTLIFLFINDRGFAILFIFYLLLKNTLTSFACIIRPPRNVSFKYFIEPKNNFLFAFLFLSIYLFFLNYKPAFYLLIEYKTYILAFLVFLICYIIYLLHLRKVYIWFLCLLLIILISLTNNFINSYFENQLKNVKYRTQILFTPLENILFNEEYSSNNETKLLQTAQNQWYINSYINPEILDYKSNYINFRPHFKTGVDYSTQTRDLIIPRYVISEYGHVTVVILLLLLLLPIIIYIPTYKISSNNINENLSLTSFYALIFIFTLSLFVWLTATNRLVFFGQDFPFLSLTSRLSIILPLSLFCFVLLSEPAIKLNHNFNLKQRLTPFIVFTFFLLINIIIAVKKSNYLKEDKFSINFKNVEINLQEKLNEILYKIQQPDPQLSIENFESLNTETLKKIGTLLGTLKTNPEFLQIENKFSNYEKTMIKSLFEKPKQGFLISNPLTFKLKDDRIMLGFNQSWHLELPVYNIDKVWKADILAQNYITKTTKDILEISSQLTGDGGDILTIPNTYMIDTSSIIGILSLNTKNSNARAYSNIKGRVINLGNKSLTTSDTRSFSTILQNKSIYIVNSDDNKIQIEPFKKNTDNYFAQSYNINGYQRLLYPLEQNYFWIKNWANYIQDYKQKNNDLNTDYTINLDYDLTNAISKFISQNHIDLLAKNNDMTFSTIAADGNGRITLLFDYANQRPFINPNDENQYNDELTKDFFDINPKVQRLKWGNINFLRMDIGPGSSVKPLISSAIASQLNLGWENILVNGDNAPNSENPGYKKLNKYAGLPIKSGWNLEKDPNGGFVAFNKYLSTSDNLFHSVLIFLGSYTKDNYKLNGKYSLSNILDNSPFDTLSNYPILKINNEIKYLPSLNSINKSWPTTNLKNNSNINTYFASNNSLLANGINNNLKIKFEPSDVYNNTNIYTTDLTSFYDSNFKKWVWSFPEESYFRNQLRNDNNLKTNFEKAIRNTTLGGEPYQVTPLSILEMYGKLISQNSKFSLKIDGTSTSNYDWSIDTDTWDKKNAFNTFLSDFVFKGMKECVTIGTAKKWLSNVDKKKYYLYAKTGTSGNKKDYSSSRRLIVLITKYKIDSSNIDNNKFYSIYFTFNKIYNKDNNKETWYYPYTQTIINSILNSESFNNYMQ